MTSSGAPSADTVLRRLQGTLATVTADQGFLMGRGGFTTVVLREARRRFFSVRRCDAADPVTAALRHDERLPKALQAALPLKRLWALVPEK